MNRADSSARVAAGESWDVVIIGGGATGSYAALDAASRGYRTLLVERGDFASGTSSRSTKLIHGGVRYLRQGRPGLVRASLRERTLLLQNAPDYVHERTFVVPVFSGWEKLYYGIGLKVYDLLASGHQPTPSRLLSKAEAAAALPTLRTDRLTGGVRYSDGQFDDTALVLALLRAATEHGAAVLNYTAVVALRKEAGRVCGVELRDEETGATHAVTARVVINATGVFSDEVRRLDEPGAATTIAPSQGAHVVLPREFLPGDTALMIPKTSDGRLLFVIPWQGRVLVGTTDTAVDKIARAPVPLAEEIDFLLEHAALYLTRAPTRADVLSAFAGLRPLVRASRGKTSALSRDHVIRVAPSGLVTIAGGKWTTARKMAEAVINRAAEVGALPRRVCRTESHALPAPELFAGNGDNLTAADVVACARTSMARTVEDVLSRRTLALYRDARGAGELAPLVAATLAAAHGRGEAWQAEQLAVFRALVRQHLP